MKEIINERYREFMNKYGIEDNGGGSIDEHSFEKFIEYLESGKTYNKTVDEEEAFRDYQNYRSVQKKCRSHEEAHKIFDSAWQRMYKKKGFKRLTSRKSAEYLKTWQYVKKDNLFGIVFGIGFDGYGGIDTAYFGLEEISSKLGMLYVVRTISSFVDDGFEAVFTSHFFHRYAERTGLKISKRDQILKTFLTSEFDDY